jgi:hypothetical protein
VGEDLAYMINITGTQSEYDKLASDDKVTEFTAQKGKAWLFLPMAGEEEQKQVCMKYSQ